MKKRLLKGTPPYHCHPASIYETASFHLRLVAFFIDGFLLSTFNTFFYSFINTVLIPISFISTENSDVISIAFVLFLNLLYFQMGTYYKGQTLGKRIVGIQVVSLNGYHIKLGQSILRTLGYFISLGSLGIGFFAAMWEKKEQCWHDIVAETIVINLKENKKNIYFKDMIQALSEIQKEVSGKG